MPVDYNPKDAVQCWPEGYYDMELIKVEDKVSKSSGNSMQVWTWRATNDGREQTINDYVVVPAATFKIKQLAAALDKKDIFDAGRFQADDEIGCVVSGFLTIESQDGYDDKNKVKKVVAKTVGSTMATGMRQRQRAPVPTDLPENEVNEADIPF